jgi:hypothetical protein
MDKYKNSGSKSPFQSLPLFMDLLEKAPNQTGKYPARGCVKNLAAIIWRLAPPNNIFFE